MCFTSILECFFHWKSKSQNSFSWWQKWLTWPWTPESFICVLDDNVKFCLESSLKEFSWLTKSNMWAVNAILVMCLLWLVQSVNIRHVSTVQETSKAMSAFVRQLGVSASNTQQQWFFCLINSLLHNLIIEKIVLIICYTFLLPECILVYKCWLEYICDFFFLFHCIFYKFVKGEDQQERGAN